MMKPRLLDQVRDAIRRPIMAPTGWRFPSTGTFGDQYPCSDINRKINRTFQIFGKRKVSTPGLRYNGGRDLVELSEPVADMCLKRVF